MNLDRGAVQTAVENLDLDFEETLYEGYRGRGEESPTWGLVLEHERQIDEFFVEISAFSADYGHALAAVARRDGMGKRLIVYFPGVELVLL